jgi:hypothetical protein
VDEFRATPETADQVRSTQSLGNKPLAVITAGTQSAEWHQMQKGLAALSSNSIHRIVKDAAHESLLYNESDAQVTSAAIKEVVHAVRSDQPLTGWIPRGAYCGAASSSSSTPTQVSPEGEGHDTH